MGNKGEIANKLAEVFVLFAEKFALYLPFNNASVWKRSRTYPDSAKSSRLLNHIKVVRNQSFIEHALKKASHLMAAAKLLAT